MVHMKLQNRDADLLMGSRRHRISVKSQTLPPGGKIDPNRQDPPSRRENMPKKERLIQNDTQVPG